MKNLIQLKGINRDFRLGDSIIKALCRVNLEINKGEFVALKGPSGSGKSTLLHILGLLDKPSEGKYWLENKTVDRKTKPKTLAKLRLNKIGFIFQTFNLIPRMSALANVELPMIYSKVKNRRRAALRLLKSVGLEKRAKHGSDKLSGGERQRVAIARALANNPEIILADEPTGNLDTKTGRHILEILIKLQKQGKTLIVVTHDEEIAGLADRIIEIKDGKVRNLRAKGIKK